MTDLAGAAVIWDTFSNSLLGKNYYLLVDRCTPKHSFHRQNPRLPEPQKIWGNWQAGFITTLLVSRISASLGPGFPVMPLAA